MTRQIDIEHVFVDAIPEQLEEATLYISVPYTTATHLCFCGCGHEVVTPLSPTDWRVTFDGETVSLAPSVGNWSFECQSHYWIERNTVEWAPRWSRDRIERGRARDALAKRWQFADEDAVDVTPATNRSPSQKGGPARRLWLRVRSALLSR